MSDRIKKCPHCGGVPTFEINYSVAAGNGVAEIHCCATMSEGFVLEYYKPRKVDSESFAVEKLIAKWNRRSANNDLERCIELGSEIFADVPDDWVDKLRGN